MKTTRKNLRHALLLITLTATLPLSTWALPPIPHAITGKIARIDQDSRELTITNNHERLLVHWKRTTRFTYACLTTGIPVKVYYRKEAGRFVARDVITRGSNECEACCK
jgi:hypothetical protein